MIAMAANRQTAEKIFFGHCRWGFLHLDHMVTQLCTWSAAVENHLALM